MTKILTAALASAGLFAIAAPAQAAILNGSYQITVSTGVTNGNGIDTANPSPFTPGAANTASATFTYTGPLSFTNNAAQGGIGADTNSSFGFTAANISNYNGGGTVSYNGTQVADFTGVNSFLASSGSAAGQPYASFYSINLGTLGAGTVVTVTHDDGAALFQNGARVGNTVSGPTGQVTDVVTLGNTAATTLTYSRQNGTPSILTVSAVPEPATWAMMIAGFGLVGGAMRRRSTKVAYA